MSVPLSEQACAILSSEFEERFPGCRVPLCSSQYMDDVVFPVIGAETTCVMETERECHSQRLSKILFCILLISARRGFGWKTKHLHIVLVFRSGCRRDVTQPRRLAGEARRLPP